MQTNDPGPRAEAPALVRRAPPLSKEATNASQTADQAALETGELYRLIGVIETAHFVETVSAKVIAQAYCQAKLTLEKQGSVVVRTRQGEVKRVSGLEEFCDAVMHVSARRCRQIASSMDTLGEALFEQAERIGFRARDYQALKALPEDDQELVKAAIEGGDREQTIDLLVELAARNRALRKKSEEATKTLAAKDKVIQSKSAKLDKLEEVLAVRDHLPINEQERSDEQELRDNSLLTDYRVVIIGVDDATIAQ